MEYFMNNIEELFNKEWKENICNFVEEKMYLLNEIKEFKEKDKLLSDSMEEMTDLLTENLTEKFYNIIRLSYEVDEYYLLLAYYLGVKYGKKIDEL